MATSRIDPVSLNSWQVIAAKTDIAAGTTRRSQLFGMPLTLHRNAGGDVVVTADRGSLPVTERYGYIWTSLGQPNVDIFPIPEYDEPDRRNMNAASLRVHVSAPRAVENFLDLGHLAFVHPGVLGDESRAEIRDYEVEVSAERDEILATRCLLYQPKSAPGATTGTDVHYIFRVPHPFCTVLYKSSNGDPNRMDVIGLLTQPLDEEHCCAHLFVSRIDAESAETRIRAFQLSIFGQDKPILENQVPKRLPLDPRAEMPVRSDASSIAYRRWLREKGVTYGTQ
jgi:phenylpropionate dioxygenase-like ring-hydroxylating dioxygenase large terminal subunit